MRLATSSFVLILRYRTDHEVCEEFSSIQDFASIVDVRIVVCVIVLPGLHMFTSAKDL